MNKINMGRHIVLMLFFSVVMSTVISCISFDLTKVNIAGITSVLHNKETDAPVTSIIPGQDYFLKITVNTKSGMRIKHPDYNHFFIKDAAGLVDSEIYSDKELLLYSNMNTYNLSGTNSYGLTIEVLNDEFAPVNYSWPVDWSEFNRLVYCGGDGKYGMFGASGMMNNSVSGEDGSSGTNGENGALIMLEIAYYSIKKDEYPGLSGEKAILIHNITSGDLIIMPLHNFLIDVSGGDGGKGGHGGHGGDDMPAYSAGGSSTANSFTHRTGGCGGAGGDGGHGGNGGAVTVYYAVDLNDPIIKYFQVDVSAGKGGNGGTSGRHGTNNTIFHWINHENPSNGQDGTNGFEGSFTLKSVNSTDKLFTDIDAGIERERVF